MSNTNTKGLEERVAALELEVAELRHVVQRSIETKDPRSTFGMFKSDPVIAEIVELGRQWREEENRKSLEEFDRST